MYCPVVLRASASTFSAALLLFPRSSPSRGVAVGVGVGVGAGLASDNGDPVKEATASRTDVSIIFGLFIDVFLQLLLLFVSARQSFCDAHKRVSAE
jgi:hypothetical protein